MPLSRELTSQFDTGNINIPRMDYIVESATSGISTSRSVVASILATPAETHATRPRPPASGETVDGRKCHKAIQSVTTNHAPGPGTAESMAGTAPSIGRPLRIYYHPEIQRARHQASSMLALGHIGAWHGISTAARQHRPNSCTRWRARLHVSTIELSQTERALLRRIAHVSVLLRGTVRLRA
ncbi:uncharacterized protein B0I36DRAFT_43825 [Microdochium trichocladiopsis]|uniref:Uncharacterized protein n=1 Tax=Microdochium trichocladiopsis TaxID=1682393 RepID=A0A9P8XSR2_9PEZI|nr:uncharacterized protein B0I36DRAFT_43825 [Microdochium trichocladiopsis]KAH7016228.1 hypothetical protein B0I36DRAFT_43825 [Microdochium trichocladiopsis]